MTTRQQAETLIARDEIVAAPNERACDDHSFEFPTRIYVAMMAMFTGFVVVLATAFTGHMGVTFGAIFAFVAAFFAIPIMMTRMASDSRTSALEWHEFAERGIATETGHSSAGPATILVLALPFLILCFGFAIAILWMAL